MFGKAILAITMLAVAACTSTEQTHQRISQTWVGKHVNLFFIENGPPGYKAANPDGTILYLWQEGTTVSSPGTINVTKIGGVYQVSTIGGYFTSLKCRVAIITDKSGKILRFTNMRSTIGAWQISRCNEVLR